MHRPSANIGEPIRTVFFPKAENAPSEDVLGDMVKIAKQHQGYDVELSWRLPACTNSMRLMGRSTKEKPVTLWKLTEIDGKEKNVIWDEQTDDLEVVCDIVGKFSHAFFRTEDAPRSEAPKIEVEEDLEEDWAVEGEEEEPEEQVNDLDFLGEAMTSVQVLSDQLQNLSTGLRSFSALLKYIENECYRFEAYGVPVSLIIFEISHPTIDPIPLQAISTAALRVDLIKRPADILGHFESDYALLLAHTQRPTALLMANKILQVLSAGPLAPGLDKSSLKFSFGIASLPDDGDDLESLINAAKAAKSQARERALSI